MLDTKFWKKYFEVYDVLNDLIPYQELLDSIIEKLEIQPSDLVLDAGSGTGNLAVKIEKLGARVVGIDMSEAGVELHKKKIPNADVRVGDLTEPLPFPDEHFDKICSNNVIYTLPPKKRQKVFTEFYRVLKPKGVIVVSNVHKTFSPVKIYKYHIKSDFKKAPLTLPLRVLRFSLPTIKMFIFNGRIKKENKSGSYSFLSLEEQNLELKRAGFSNIEGVGGVYAGQAVLSRGEKQ